MLAPVVTTAYAGITLLGSGLAVAGKALWAFALAHPVITAVVGITAAVVALAHALANMSGEASRAQHTLTEAAAARQFLNRSAAEGGTVTNEDFQRFVPAATRLQMQGMTPAQQREFTQNRVQQLQAQLQELEGSDIEGRATRIEAILQSGQGMTWWSDRNLRRRLGVSQSGAVNPLAVGNAQQFMGGFDLTGSHVSSETIRQISAIGSGRELRDQLRAELQALQGGGGQAAQMTLMGRNVPQQFQAAAQPFLFYDMQARQFTTAGEMSDAIQNESIRSEGHQEQLMQQLQGLARLLEQIEAHTGQAAGNTGEGGAMAAGLALAAAGMN
jgi:hypothetical protein